MEFNIPHSGDFDKFRSKRSRKKQAQMYRAIEQIRAFQRREVKTPSRRGGLTHEEFLDLLMQGIAYRLTGLADGGIAAWNSGYPLVTALCARAIMETICSTHYLVEKSKEYTRAKNLPALRDFLFGQTMHYRPMMKKHKFIPMPSIGILTDQFANKVFTKDKRAFLDSYDLLSQIAHPNWPGTLGFFSALIKSEERQVFDPNGTHNAQVFNEVWLAYFLLAFFQEFVSGVEEVVASVAELEQ